MGHSSIMRAKNIWKSYSANSNFDTKYTIAPIISFLIENADAREKELFSLFF